MDGTDEGIWALIKDLSTSQLSTTHTLTFMGINLFWNKSWFADNSLIFNSGGQLLRKFGGKAFAILDEEILENQCVTY